jgi:anti-sigma B factor antagonist
MLLEIIELGDAGHLQLKGELDLSGEEALSAAIDAARTRAGQLRLDLSELTFMDSSGLRVILRAVLASNGSGPVVLERPSPTVRRLLDVALPTGAPGLEVRE